MTNATIVLSCTVIIFAIVVVSIASVWIYILHCLDAMADAWKEMRNREWRWPEGTNGVYGPGDEPHHRRKNK